MTALDDLRQEVATLRRKLAARQDGERRHEAQLAFLSETAADFFDMSGADDIYAFIGERLQSLVPSAIVVLSEFDPRSGELVTRNILGLGSLTDRLAKLLGRDPRTMSEPPTPVLRRAMMTGRFERIPGGVAAVSGDLVPSAAVPLVETLFSVDDVYVQGMVRGSEILGNAVIVTRSGHAVEQPGLVEAFVAQAAVALARYRAEKSLKDSEEQLLHTQKLEAIGTLAGGIAHDFNNMLTGILTQASLLLRRGDLDESLREGVQTIEESALRGAELTKGLLGFARKGQLTIVNLDLDALTRRVVRMLSHTLDRRILISQQVVGGSLQVAGDHSQLEQLLINLGLNASDAMPSGGVLHFGLQAVAAGDATLRSLPQLPAKDYVTVSVSDNGCGIPDALKDRIFEPFFTTKPEGQGTGMGWRWPMASRAATVAS